MGVFVEKVDDALVHKACKVGGISQQSSKQPLNLSFGLRIGRAAVADGSAAKSRQLLLKQPELAGLFTSQQ